MPLKFDCNLERIASIATAVNLWESPDIKTETADFFKGIPYNDPWRSHPRLHTTMEIKWKTISEKVVHRAESVNLPEIIQSELKPLIHFVGQKILHWAQFVRISLELNQKCLGKMFFTSVGTIDETKFFNYLRENPSLCISDDEEDDTLMKNCKIYTLACILIQEDFIGGHLQEMRDMTESYFVLGFVGSLNVATLIRVWISFYITSDRKMKLKLPNQKMPLGIYSDSILLRKCKADGLVKAATYFALGSVKDETFLVDNITEIANGLVHFAPFLQEKYLEMIVFFVNEMPDKDKIDAIARRDLDIFGLLFNAWPQQELLLPNLNVLCDNIEADERFTIFLKSTLNGPKMPEYLKTTEKSVLHMNKTQLEILRKVLQLIPNEVKKEWIPNWIKKHLEWFFKTRDFSTIAIIFDDDELKDSKIELTPVTGRFFVKFIEQTNFEFIDDFLHAANFSVKETKTLKNKYFDFLERFAKDEKLDSAEKLLNWMCVNSSEDKKRLKRQINTLTICKSYYSEKNFNISVIDKLLNWQFDGDAESIKKIKSEIWSEELLTDVICKIWADHCHSSTEKAKSKCSEFFEWFSDVESEEINAFEKEKLIKDENFLKKFCDNLHFAEDLKTIDELFKFCSLSSDKIKEIKGIIRDNADHWIHLLGIEKSDFRVANAVVNWISENENEKKEIIEKYLNSSKGVGLFSKVLEHNNFRVFLDPILIFLNEWVQPYGNFSKIKQIVGIYWEKSIYKFLLDRLKRNGCISPNDIQCSINFSKKYQFLDIE